MCGCNVRVRVNGGGGEGETRPSESAWKYLNCSSGKRGSVPLRACCDLRWACLKLFNDLDGKYSRS